MKQIYVFLSLLLLSASLNAQWIETNFNDSNVLLCVDFNVDNGVLGGWHLPEFLVNAYYTTNQGTTWYPAQTPDSLRVIVDLQIINNSLIYGCGARNKIIYPDNFADTKSNELLSDRREMLLFRKGIVSAPDNEEYRAQFLQSTDMGHSWQYKGFLEDTITYLIDLQFLDQNTGYVLALNENSSGILRTTDGGETWNSSFIAGPDIELHGFGFLDASNGYVVGADPNAGGLIAKTTDGGATWTTSVLNGIVEVTDIKCIPPSNVVISGIDVNFGQNISISTDNGSSWSQVYYIENGQVDGINGLPGSWIIFYGTYEPTGSSTPFVNGTTNFGQSWVESTLSPLTNLLMAGSRMIDSQRWYITGTFMLNYGFLLSTSNSGGLPVEIISFTAAQNGKSIRLEWSTASETNNLGFEIQRKTSSADFAAVGFVKGKGTTSEKQFYSFTDQPEGIDDKIVYRLKQIDLDGSFSYSDEVSADFAVPLEFSLSQNYPNPFNPVTKISYSVPQTVPVSLKVYNLLGQEIAVLVSEVKTPGVYEVDFDAAELPSGMYLYRLEAGSFTETRRMLLLK